MDSNGDHPQTYDGLGIALYRQGRYAEAVEELMRSIGLLYHQPVVHFHLGVALAAAGHPDGAIASLERAVEFEPAFWRAHQALAAVHRARGELGRTAVHLSEARRLRKRKRAHPAGV